jgi:chromosome segregation ATPase
MRCRALLRSKKAQDNSLKQTLQLMKAFQEQANNANTAANTTEKEIAVKQTTKVPVKILHSLQEDESAEITTNQAINQVNLASLERKIIELSKALEEASDTKNNLAKEKAELTIVIKELQQDSKQQISLNNKQQKQISRLEKKLINLQDNKSEITPKTSENGQQRSAVEELSDELAEMQLEKQELADKASNAKLTIEALNKQIDLLSARIASDQGKNELTRTQAENKDLIELNESRKLEMTQLNRDLKQLGKQYKTQLDLSNSSLLKLHNREQIISEIREIELQHTEQIQSLTAQLKVEIETSESAQREIKQIQSAEKTLQREVAQLKQELESRKAGINMLESELSSLAEAKNVVASQLQELQNHQTQLKEQLQQTQASCSNQKIQIQEFKQENANLESIVAEAKSSIAALEAKMDYSAQLSAQLATQLKHSDKQEKILSIKLEAAEYEIELLNEEKSALLDAYNQSQAENTASNRAAADFTSALITFQLSLQQFKETAHDEYDQLKLEISDLTGYSDSSASKNQQKKTPVELALEFDLDQTIAGFAQPAENTTTVIAAAKEELNISSTKRVHVPQAKNLAERTNPSLFKLLLEKQAKQQLQFESLLNNLVTNANPAAANCVIVRADLRSPPDYCTAIKNPAARRETTDMPVERRIWPVNNISPIS